jgi:hypothetical protein
VFRDSISLYFFSISASLGDFCNLAVDQEFLTTDCTEYTDKSGLDRQGAENAKVLKISLEPVFRDSISLYFFSISAALGDLCNLAVDQEFLTTDCTEYTDKSGLDRQVAKNAKVFRHPWNLCFETQLAFILSQSLRPLATFAPWR